MVLRVAGPLAPLGAPPVPDTRGMDLQASHGRSTVRRGLAPFVLALALVAVACGGGGGTGGGEQAAAAPTPVQVMLSDFKIEPSSIQVPSGTPLSLDVMNHGPSPHTFAVVVNGQQIVTPEIAPGTSETLAVPALDPGTYDALCTIPGHADLGMKATVTAASADGTTAAAVGSTASAPQAASMSAQQMAAMHEQGVKDFLAGHQTSTQGNQPLRPTVEHGVKVFNLTVTQMKWEISKGQFVDAMAFNGQIPGPAIRVRQGDRVRFVVQNQMDQPTVVHFHGMTVPNAMDGVPYVTQPPIMPGQYWTYSFTIVDPPGMYVYHSHFNSTEQVGSGLYGAIMVLPRTGAWRYPSFTVDDMGYLHAGAPAHISDEYTMFLSDGPLGYVINGKSFPATTPLTAKRGDWVLIHLANDGSMLHPMHLHGYHFEVVAQDGYPLDQPYLADTLVVAPGQRFDILVHAVHPGAWAFHCHILPHVEGPQGMYGMVTALVVT
jgi:FtsP/CotA-like multicopper oxidase with cupredoxin domain/plastocyanin